MQQEVNRTYDDSQKNLGELVVGIRIDALPVVEADRLAGEGKFHPLTIDPDGAAGTRSRKRVPDRG